MDAEDELLTIGEVAKLDGITTKALRYYDAHGILKPAAVDPMTGYRYYTPDQMLDVDVMRIFISSGIRWNRWNNTVSKMGHWIGGAYWQPHNRKLTNA